jgi:hypothetical protein
VILGGSTGSAQSKCPDFLRLVLRPVLLLIRPGKRREDANNLNVFAVANRKLRGGPSLLHFTLYYAILGCVDYSHILEVIHSPYFAYFKGKIYNMGVDSVGTYILCYTTFTALIEP